MGRTTWSEERLNLILIGVAEFFGGKTGELLVQAQGEIS
jgi:hypothetical protein